MKKNNQNKFFIVVSEFYPELSNSLLDDCISYMRQNGYKKSDIQVYKVSGVFELPGAVNLISKYHSPEAIITLGVVIKGETPHFDFISSACANTISKLTIKNKFPIIFGVLTTNSYKQASIRSQEKGIDIARTAIQSIDTYKKIKS
tara:strand:+ start:183 stop:620 length:438 start_codon:yes stop_codon:yes gene_type:complete